jgi:hypothetical protein
MLTCLSAIPLFIFKLFSDKILSQKSSETEHLMSSPPASPLGDAIVSSDAIAARKVLERLDKRSTHGSALKESFPVCYNRPDRVRVECERLIMATNTNGALPAIMFDTGVATPCNTFCWKGSYAYVTPCLFQGAEVVCKFTFLSESDTPVFDLGLLCNEVLKITWINNQLDRGIRFVPPDKLFKSFEVAVPKQLQMGYSSNSTETMVVQVLTYLGAFDGFGGPLTAREILKMATDKVGRTVLMS